MEIGLKGNTFGSLDATSWRNLGSLPKGSTVKVSQNGAATGPGSPVRIFDVDDVQEWKNAFEVQARRWEFNSDLKKGLIQLDTVGQLASGRVLTSDIERKAAAWSFADQLKTEQIAHLLHPLAAGKITLNGTVSPFSFDLANF